MILSRFVALPLVLCVACASQQRAGQTPTPRESFAFIHAGVVDVESGRVLPDQTVRVAGNRIRDVGPSAAVILPPGMPVVDASGQFLIPGLWDMHVHVVNARYRAAFPALVANGVTGVRDMWGRLDYARLLRGRIASGRVIGPRFTLSGNLIDGDPPVHAGSVVVTTAAEGRRVVDSLRGAGAEFIKPYGRLSRTAYFAVVDQAERRSMWVAGHVPLRVGLRDAVAAGQRSIEHMEEFFLACSPEEDALRRSAIESDSLAARDTARPPALLTQRRRALATNPDATCDGPARLLAQHGTWVVPTLTLTKIGLQSDSSAVDSQLLRYLPAADLRTWDATARRRSARTERNRELARHDYDQITRLVGSLHRAGVRMLAGTDFPNVFPFPGFGLHVELEALVESGLSPAEALRAATIDPARYLETTDSLGSVATGKVADLVLLSANPLDDIRNTRRISAVMLNGRYLDRAMLDELLNDVARVAGATRAAP